MLSKGQRNVLRNHAWTVFLLLEQVGKDSPGLKESGNINFAHHVAHHSMFPPEMVYKGETTMPARGGPIGVCTHGCSAEPECEESEITDLITGL